MLFPSTLLHCPGKSSRLLPGPVPRWHTTTCLRCPTVRYGDFPRRQQAASVSGTARQWTSSSVAAGGADGTHLLEKTDFLSPWNLFQCCMIFSRLLKRAWGCYTEINCCISIAIFSTSVASSFASQFYFSKSHTPRVEFYGDIL